MVTGSNARTWRPATTRHRVSGVDSSRPIGPHSAPQNSAETITASGDRPELWPYTFGSITFATSSSSATKTATQDRASVQPGSMAATNTAIMAPAAMMPR